MSTQSPDPGAEQPPVATIADPGRRLLEETLGAQYEILRQLGQGGAGVVYLARERLLERLVAIKLLRSELLSADSRERFVREARTAAKLMHAHIVPLYAFGQAGDTLYYIMGYVEGESLETMLRRTMSCESAEARRILVEVANALDYAHRNGVIHRDVKPDNILIERESRRAILTDFGIAKLQATPGTLTATGIIVGTPLYMSPEQAAGDRQVDGRADLYALGVIGYRMLAGRLPFEGVSAQDILMKHVTQDPPALVGLAPAAPVDLSWAITRCLDKDPGRRWPTLGAFRQALESGEDLTGELPEPLEHLSGSVPRVAITAWGFLVAGALGWTATARIEWLIGGAAATTLAAASPAFLHWRARRFGLDGLQVWRLLAAPPERWVGWWPEYLRRPGDIWAQLPAIVRRYRSARSMALAFIALLLAPVVAVLALAAGGIVAATVAATGILLTALVLMPMRATAARSLALRGGQDRTVRRLLDEPTWRSVFWRRDEALPFLAEPPGLAKPAIDSNSEDPYCAGTPIQPGIPQGMFDHVDARSPTPLYAQIASRLRVAIAAGELKPGDGLPSVRTLAGRLRINPATVVQAYRELEVEGLVSTRHGAGTFVEEVAADRKSRDRQQEARRLIREMLAEAASLGINGGDLRSALEQELEPRSGR